MKISKLLKQKVEYNHIVNKISVNSKEVSNNDIFVAIKGLKNNGQDFIDEAIQNGAKTIILEEDVVYKKNNINYVLVKDSRKALAIVANRLFRDISKKVCLIGITGTNGKTTTSTLVYKYFRYLKKKVTLIGTNGVFMNDEYFEISNTTPNIVEILTIIKEGYKKGIKHVVMEVSSHAIKQLRVYGLDFNIALLTNLTQDHLDFHKTFEDYRYTKGLFLSSIKNGLVLLNKDIPDYLFFIRMSDSRVKSFGKNRCDYMFHNEVLNYSGSEFLISVEGKVHKVKTTLLGIFNVYNIMSFIAIIDNLKLFSNKTLEFLNSDLIIPGRMEFVRFEDKLIVVDFAHTPDGVLNVLKYLNTIKLNRLVVVMGCGGNRDRSKREIIGEIISKNCDFFYVTSDNPRWENNIKIMEQIKQGIVNNNYKIIDNRYEAITEAIKDSQGNDIIAILGKGNEQYQIIKDKMIPFNDKKIVKDILGVKEN